MNMYIDALYDYCVEAATIVRTGKLRLYTANEGLLPSDRQRAKMYV